MASKLEQPTKEKHPKGFMYIFWGELAERSSFYGVMVLITAYLMSQLHFTQGKTGVVVHSFKALAYILPIAGGYIADRWLGKFRTVIYFSVPYIVGHLVLGGFQTEGGLYLALLLLAAGSGTIKPNVGPLMGLMYDQENKSPELRQRAFSYFYAAINIGAVVSMTTLPGLRTKYGYGVAFMVPAILMIISLVIFYMGKPHYPKEEVRREENTAAEKMENRQVLLGLAGIFTTFVFFWCVYDQQNTTWVFFAKEMKLYGLEPDAIQWLNPALIMLFVPLFNWLWKKLGERGFTMRATDKMLVGFGLAALCMVILSVAGFLSATTQVSLGWQVVAYVVLGAAEMCLSVVGLDFAFSEAPERMKSQVMAVFLLTVFAGNLLAGVITTLYAKLGPGYYFGLHALMMVAVGVFFHFVAERYNSSKQQPAIAT